jgi:hypothetical protein
MKRTGLRREREKRVWVGKALQISRQKKKNGESVKALKQRQSSEAGEKETERERERTH